MRKPLDANKLRPRPRDLFREITITLDDLDEWVKVIAPHLSHSRTRMDWYIKGWNVADKVRAAKLRGDWPPSIIRCY